MSEEPVEKLELRALEERNRLHQTAGELQDKIAKTRETLSITRQAREHFVPASLGVCFLSFIVGYGLAAMFTSRERT